MSTVNAKSTTPHDAANNSQIPLSNTHEGKLVSMTGNHMVMANTDGRKISHTLAKNVELTCDGTTCTTEELKIGRRIRVTTQRDNRNVATGVEFLDKHTEFKQCC